MSKTQETTRHERVGSQTDTKKCVHTATVACEMSEAMELFGRWMSNYRGLAGYEAIQSSVFKADEGGLWKFKIELDKPQARSFFRANYVKENKGNRVARDELNLLVESMSTGLFNAARKMLDGVLENNCLRVVGDSAGSGSEDLQPA